MDAAIDPTRPCPACRRTARPRVYADGSFGPEWSCASGHRFTIGNPNPQRCRCPTGPFGPRRKAVDCPLTPVGPFLVCATHDTVVWPADESSPVEMCATGQAVWARVLASFSLVPILHEGPHDGEVPFGYSAEEWAAVRPEPAAAPPPPPEPEPEPEPEPVVTPAADDAAVVVTLRPSAPEPRLFPVASVPVEVRRKAIGALSPSSASTLAQCPRRFELSKVLGRPEPAGRPATLGKFVHKVLELLTALPLSERTEDAAREIAGRLWADVEREPGDPLGYPEADGSGGDVDELRRDRVALRRDVADVADWIKHFKGESWAALAYAVSIEEAYGGEVAYRELKLWDSTVAGVPFRGYADRVDRHRDLTGLIVNDYKTGKAPLDKRTGLIDHDKLDEKAEQLLWYWEAIETRTGERVVGAVLAYIGYAGQVVLWVDDARRAQAEAKLQRLWRDLGRFEAKAVAGDEPYPAKTGYLCGWCPHFEDCAPGSAFLLDEWDWMERRAARGEPVPAKASIDGWGRERRQRWLAETRAAS